MRTCSHHKQTPQPPHPHFSTSMWHIWPLVRDSSPRGRMGHHGMVIYRLAWVRSSPPPLGGGHIVARGMILHQTTLSPWIKLPQTIRSKEVCEMVSHQPSQPSNTKKVAYMASGETLIAKAAGTHGASGMVPGNECLTTGHICHLEVLK